MGAAGGLGALGIPGFEEEFRRIPGFFQRNCVDSKDLSGDSVGLARFPWNSRGFDKDSMDFHGF